MCRDLSFGCRKLLIRFRSLDLSRKMPLVSASTQKNLLGYPKQKAATQCEARERYCPRFMENCDVGGANERKLFFKLSVHAKACRALILIVY